LLAAGAGLKLVVLIDEREGFSIYARLIDWPLRADVGVCPR
jgi:hypothetical protein